MAERIEPESAGERLNNVMQNWYPYVKASWEIVVEAQGASKTFLQPEIESFLVHTIARTFECTTIWEQPIAIKMFAAQSLPGLSKRIELRAVGEECLFIDAWQIKSNKWPNPRYFANMGEIAFGMASIATQPADSLLDLVSNNFQRMSQVLRQVKNLYQHNN